MFMLIAARAVQGLGAGGLLSLTQVIMGDITVRALLARSSAVLNVLNVRDARRPAIAASTQPCSH